MIQFIIQNCIFTTYLVLLNGLYCCYETCCYGLLVISYPSFHVISYPYRRYSMLLKISPVLVLNTTSELIFYNIVGSQIFEIRNVLLDYKPRSRKKHTTVTTTSTVAVRNYKPRSPLILKTSSGRIVILCKKALSSKELWKKHC